MSSHFAATAAALAAADRANVRIGRVRDLLTKEGPEKASLRDVQNALVESILANVAFASAVRGAMRCPAPDRKGVPRSMPLSVSTDYAWAREDVSE